jgi:5-methylthioadenosine/S-adenosylhomocysteine deaminase
VGTDSRASNPDLNLLTELRFLAERHGVRLDVALELGTLAGAEALGRQQQIGSLEPGKQADLCAVALPCEEAADPHELVLCFDGLVVATYCRGRRVHPPPCCQAAPRPPGQAPA